MRLGTACCKCGAQPFSPPSIDRSPAHMTTSPSRLRIAAMSDVHCGKTSQGTLHPTFTQAVEHADVLVLAGDLTDYGLAEEAKVLAKELAGVHVPIIAVLGNHDFEAGQEE